MRRLVALDTNLLVLFVVGLTSPRYIARHKRCRAYHERDFHLLEGLLLEAADIILMPNILSETSNLLRQGADAIMAVEIGLAFRALVESKAEVYVPSRAIVRHERFQQLGLTDTALLHIEDPNCVIVTADHTLYLLAGHTGRTAIHFSHLQAAAG